MGAGLSRMVSEICIAKRKATEGISSGGSVTFHFYLTFDPSKRYVSFCWIPSVLFSGILRVNCCLL